MDLHQAAFLGVELGQYGRLGADFGVQCTSRMRQQQFDAVFDRGQVVLDAGEHLRQALAGLHRHGNRVRVEVASADDRSIWTALATSRSTDAPSSRRDRAETRRTTRGITTPEDHLRARVPHWVAKAAEATRRDRTGTARERLSRHRARLENARPPKSGDLTVSWAGDFEAVDLMLLRHYPRQYARDPDRRTRKVRLVFGTAKSAYRAIATLRARLARLEADGVIRSTVAEASPP